MGKKVTITPFFVRLRCNKSKIFVNFAPLNAPALAKRLSFGEKNCETRKNKQSIQKKQN